MPNAQTSSACFKLRRPHRSQFIHSIIRLARGSLSADHWPLGNFHWPTEEVSERSCKRRNESRRRTRVGRRWSHLRSNLSANLAAARSSQLATGRSLLAVFGSQLTAHSSPRSAHRAPINGRRMKQQLVFSGRRALGNIPESRNNSSPSSFVPSSTLSSALARVRFSARSTIQPTTPPKRSLHSCTSSTFARSKLHGAQMTTSTDKQRVLSASFLEAAHLFSWRRYQRAERSPS